MLSALAAVVFCILPSYAQDTLTVSRISAEASTAVTLQSAPVQSISGSDMQRLGIRDLHEALRGFAGVNIRDYGGIGGVKTVSIRNLGAQHTAVSYDGIAISDTQSGQIDISRFSLDNVGSVSVVIGQNDDIFQNAKMFASAGTLNIRTMHPHFDGKKTNASVSMTYASFKTFNPSVLLEQKLGQRWAVGATADWLKSDGTYPFTIQNGTILEKHKRLNSDVNRVRGEVNLYGKIGQTGILDIKGNYLYSERGLPGSIVFYNEKANERLWDRNAFASAAYSTDLSDKLKLKSSLKYTFSWNRYLDTGEIYPSGKEDDNYTQREVYGSATVMFTPSNPLSFSFATDVSYNTLDSNIPECAFPKRLSSLSVLAGRYKTERFTATASLLGSFISEKVSKGTAAPDRKHLSPAVSFSFKPWNDFNLRIRASYKNSFRVPTFNDLYYSRVGNTSLKPEKADQCNLGLTWSGTLFSQKINYARFTADGYYNTVRDKIVARPTLFIWKMMNVGRVRMAGADLSAEIHSNVAVGQEIIASGSFSYQFAVDVTDPQAKNYKHQIPYAPRHSGSFSATWQNPWVNISYSLTGVGKRYALPQNIESNLVKGYFEHTLSLSHDFNLRHISLRLQGEAVNFTNSQYCVIQYYPMPGRSFRLSLKIKY